MNTIPTSISAVVITLNEAKNIARCIKSLQQITNDIVVVDNGSTDETLLIAKKLGARTFHRDWTGYSDQKNYGNTLAKYDFILSLDADECLTEELAEAIKKEFLSPTHSVYELDFLTSWGNKFIKHGAWVPDWHCCLFDKTKIHWGRKDLHEELELNGLPAKRLQGYILHYTAESKEHYRLKMTRYAEEFMINNKAKNKRYPFWKKYLSTLARFIKDYILSLGFLEGRAGLEIAIEEARYTFLKYKWSE